MRTHSWLIVVVLACCSGPSEPPVKWSETIKTPSPFREKPYAAVLTDPTAGHSSGPYNVAAQTYGEFAKQTGVNLDLLSIAQPACDVYNRCNPDRQTRVVGCTEATRMEMARLCPTCGICTQGCDLPMVLAWCEGRDCQSIDRDEDPAWDECREEMKARSCEAENEPFQCAIVQELGLTLRPRDFLRLKSDWHHEIPYKHYNEVEKYRKLGRRPPRRPPR